MACFTVTVRATNASTTQPGGACVAAGATVSFTVTASPGYELSSSSPLSATGTCPAGTWSHSVFQDGAEAQATYTTGAITTACAVQLYATSAVVALPTAANAIDVTSAPYNADNHDSCATATPAQKQATTAAINAAILAILNQNNESQGQQTSRYDHVVFLPAGTYCINGPIIYGNGPEPAVCELTLQGAGVGQTILSLDDGLGFSEPVISTANCTAGTVVDGGDLASNGNVAFRNNINDLTVDTGTGNPGATGISYLGNNNAEVRNVSIVSGDGAGLVGFKADRFLDGPAFVKNLSVTGFTTGVSVGGYALYSMVFEHLRLHHQQAGGVGVSVDGQKATVAIRDLESFQTNGTVQAVVSNDQDNVLTLVDATLINTGGASTIDAITSAGSIFVRNATQTGYSSTVNGATCPFECELPAATKLNGGAEISSLNLPIEETPYYNETNGGTLSSWRDVTSGPFCGSGTGIACASPDISTFDSAPGLNAALASAAPGTTAFIKQGGYYLGPNETIEIPENVVRLVCYGATFLPVDGTTFSQGTPTFRFNSSSRTSLQAIEGCDQYVNYDGSGQFFQNVGWTSLVVNNSAGTVVIKDMDTFTYMNTPQSYGGRVFLENVNGGPFPFVNETAYCRQCNPEPGYYTSGVTHLSVTGGLLWVLGWKQEGPGTGLSASNGTATAQVEVLGAAVLAQAESGSGGINDDEPLIINNSAKVSIAGIATLGRGPSDPGFGTDYETWIEETQNGSCVNGCRIYASGSANSPNVHARASGSSSLMSLYIGYP
ncbi:MAG: glycosyl hydrolase family 28-related protein [Deltaproteobacteria bacterium]